VNFIEWRAHTITVLRQQIETRPDPVIQALLSEVMSYPAPVSQLALVTSDGPQRYATRLQIRTRLGTVSFLNTTTIFGTPTEITLSELALEMLFPADEATIAIVRSMVEEQAEQSTGTSSETPPKWWTPLLSSARSGKVSTISGESHPAAPSTPWTWKTCFAISIPMVLISCMDGSCSGDLRRPPFWHSDAVRGPSTPSVLVAGQLPALSRRRNLVRSRVRRTALRSQCDDRLEQLVAMSSKHHAEIPLILRRELGQRLPIDLVVAESGLVSLETQAPQPCRYVH